MLGEWCLSRHPVGRPSPARPLHHVQAILAWDGGSFQSIAATNNLKKSDHFPEVTAALSEGERCFAKLAYPAPSYVLIFLRELIVSEVVV